MLKILTAIGDENLNNQLRQDKNLKILENDICYKEGILEFLEKNKNIDILILYEKLPGEINLINLIENIKKINSEINIFFILENKNENLEKLLKKENIKNIFYINEINISYLINKLKNIKINNNQKLEEEIEYLKDIINKKDEELMNLKNNNINKKNITIIGMDKVGKSLILSNLKNIIKNNSKLIFYEINIKNSSEIERINYNTYKFIFIIEINLEKIKLNKNIIDNLIKENKINSQKINIIFNKIDKYSINKKIAKNIFKEFNVIGNIKLNNYSDFLLNEKNNYEKENKKLKKEYLNIIKKLNIENEQN